MPMMTESERIALCAVLGLSGIINGDFEKNLLSCGPVTRTRIIQTRDAIDALTQADKNARAQAELETHDLKYQVKELLYRIEERRDIRNDTVYRELKQGLNVA